MLSISLRLLVENSIPGGRRDAASDGAPPDSRKNINEKKRRAEKKIQWVKERERERVSIYMYEGRRKKEREKESMCEKEREYKRERKTEISKKRRETKRENRRFLSSGNKLYASRKTHVKMTQVKKNTECISTFQQLPSPPQQQQRHLRKKKSRCSRHYHTLIYIHESKDDYAIKKKGERAGKSYV